MRQPPLKRRKRLLHRRPLTRGAQEVAFQGRAEAGGVVLKVAHGEGLRGGVLIVDRPRLAPDAGPAVPRHVGHGEAVLEGCRRTEGKRA